MIELLDRCHVRWILDVLDVGVQMRSRRLLHAGPACPASDVQLEF